MPLTSPWCGGGPALGALPAPAGVLRYPAALRVWVTELRAASFDLDYEVRDGRSGEVAATARTQLVPYDLATARPQRITDLERAFLEGHRRTERSVPHA